MAAATSIKLDNELKGRVQHLAETRRRSELASCYPRTQTRHAGSVRLYGKV